MAVIVLRWGTATLADDKTLRELLHRQVYRGRNFLAREKLAPGMVKIFSGVTRNHLDKILPGDALLRALFSRRVSRSARMFEAIAPPPGQQFAEVRAVAEHQVADDEQAPEIPQRLESQIDRAARAWSFMRTPKPIAI